MTAAALSSSEELLQGESLRSAGALIWLGDFNYRIDGQYDQVKELSIAGELAPLLACDQLRREMAAGRVFRGLREGTITFPPTYKFDKGVPSPAAYDSSEKRRIPAWCDRILFRGSSPFPSPFPDDADGDGNRGKDYDEENNSNNNTTTTTSEGDIRVSALEYGCWSDVYDSDHRPVYSNLAVSLPVTDASKKRELVAALLKKFSPLSLTLGSTSPPEASLSSTYVKLHPTHVPDQMVLLSNSGASSLSFNILLGGGGAASSVEVRPAQGHVEPGCDAEIRVRASPGGVGQYSSTPQEIVVRVLLGPEYGQGGAVVVGKGRSELQFTAVVLPEFVYEDN